MLVLVLVLVLCGLYGSVLSLNQNMEVEEFQKLTVTLSDISPAFPYGHPNTAYNRPYSLARPS